MGLQALQEAIEKAQKDTFEVGTAVRWTASGRYLYAAIKTEAGWFTTSRPGNTFVGTKLDFDELLEVLARSEVSDVEIATDWESVS